MWKIEVAFKFVVCKLQDYGVGVSEAAADGRSIAQCIVACQGDGGENRKGRRRNTTKYVSREAESGKSQSRLEYNSSYSTKNCRGADDKSYGNC